MQNRIIIVSIIAAWKYNKLIELNELFIYKDVNMTQELVLYSPRALNVRRVSKGFDL